MMFFITEKGLSDFVVHYLSNTSINVIHRARKTNNNPIARACGVTIVNQSEEFQETTIVTGAALFEV